MLTLLLTGLLVTALGLRLIYPIALEGLQGKQGGADELPVSVNASTCQD